MSNEVKNVLTSKAIWGSIIALVSMFLTKYDLGDTSALANDIAGFFGVVLAIYGRIVAVKKIKVLPE